jgi:hypothetical protein
MESTKPFMLDKSAQCCQKTSIVIDIIEHIMAGDQIEVSLEFRKRLTHTHTLSAATIKDTIPHTLCLSITRQSSTALADCSTERIPGNTFPKKSGMHPLPPGKSLQVHYA